MTSHINIQVDLTADKMPEVIKWTAPDGGVLDQQTAKAMLLGLWDGQEKSALRIDLWTEKMMVDEMNDFFYQTFFRHGRYSTCAPQKTRPSPLSCGNLPKPS